MANAADVQLEIKELFKLGTMSKRTCNKAILLAPKLVAECLSMRVSELADMAIELAGG